MKDVLAVILAGGKGLAAGAADPRSGQAGGSLRRRLPDHRLHALELPQQRHAQDPRADPVQGDEPRPAHQPRLAVAISAASWASSSTSCRPSSGSTSTGIRARPTPSTRTSTRSRRSGRKYVVILAGDHIYKMNYAKLVEHHIENNADLTVGALRGAGRGGGRQFGVMEVDAESRVVGFEEKPPQPEADPRRSAARAWPRWASTSSPPASSSSSFASTPPGPAATTTSATTSSPRSSTRTASSPIPFLDENRKQDAYWRDVGTLDAYYDANMDLISVDPQLNMYDERLADPHLPAEPAAAEVRLRREGPGGPPRPGARQHRLPGLRSSPAARSSARSSGPTPASTATPTWKTRSSSRASNVGRHAKIRRAIIDKGVHIPAGIEIGYDHDLDRSRGFTVTDKGVTVIAKTDGVEHFMQR